MIVLLKIIMVCPIKLIRRDVEKKRHALWFKRNRLLNFLLNFANIIPKLKHSNKESKRILTSAMTWAEIFVRIVVFLK